SGHESAFILSQHLSKQHRPFIVQGGIGIHTASACRVAGAAGVILDDILLLLRESPLPARYRALIEQIGVEDTAVFGSPFGDPYRIVNRADFPSAQVLKEKAEEITTNFPEHGYSSAWDLVVEERVKIGNPDRHAWPFGQMVGLAALFAKKYKTVKKLFRAIYSSNHIQTIAKYQPLAPSAPLARFHNTSFPIVQGPMTRVSDSVAFAAAVATTGALPLLALAMMRAAEVETLLSEAKRVLDKQSWGIGILGFVPTELRQQQLEVVEKIKPPFALIAGGRPDQAAFLEKCSIKTYIHVPTPRLLSIFLEQGARRFVFEGAECGGHIGPLSSYVLWESMVETLIDHLPKDPVEILFAGGIHDSLSAAMAAIIAAPLVERGVKIGVLMGTAYLFTQEAVEQGAIVETFQNQALNCQQTVTVETRPGHKIRCAPTPFITTFEQKRKQLQHEGRPVSEIGEELEEFIAGRLRIASKGLERTNSLLTNIETEKQYHEGMYMIGEVASLRSSRLRCKNLHEDVSIGSTSLLNKLAKTLKTESQKDVSALDSPIAVVGIGCLLPKAEDVETLWRNLIDKVDTITEIPKERWDWRLYYDPNQTSRDKIYSKWGSFIDPIPFDPLHFGIPPKSLPSISLPQLLVLEATRRALCDAGYGDYIEDKELREQTSVFFGAANSGDLEQLYKTRSALPLCINSSDEEVWQRLPEWTEESYPGILVNIIAGRVSNRFDLGGSNFTVDAACGSSLAALEMAVRELQLGAADMVITGGVEFEQSPQAYMAFSKTRALSSQGKARVFDQNADGIVLSEGVVVLILKRLADAEMNGDRIYALIRSVAGSSDGKGMSLTAPKPEGQRRAFKRAYKIAGINPNTLGLYEAHATGTSVGDKAEIETITTVLQDSGSLPQSCAIGSAKSLLGHTRATAGMVGLVKAVMALYHRTLPPHAGVEKPVELLSSSISPVYLLSKAQPGLRSNH
ncbi:MAG: nitronate monooxygenase, partial [Blastocatellia bacterium]|nr:nitronate monooxygenase [Blastocatellia bacterium]